MKKLILLLLGLIPFGLSFLMESWMMSNQYSVLPLKLIGLLFLAFWGILGYLTSGFEKTILKSSAIIHLPGFVVILMLLYQEVILGRYLPNWIGSVSQLYYLPLINLVSSIEGIFLSRLFIGGTMGITYLNSFILMVLCYYLGGYLRTKKEYY